MAANVDGAAAEQKMAAKKAHYAQNYLDSGVKGMAIETHGRMAGAVDKQLKQIARMAAGLQPEDAAAESTTYIQVISRLRAATSTKLWKGNAACVTDWRQKASLRRGTPAANAAQLSRRAADLLADAAVQQLEAAAGSAAVAAVAADGGTTGSGESGMDFAAFEGSLQELEATGVAGHGGGVAE
jgi:hypothetical protein